MNLNLVDLSNSIKTEYIGQFNDIISRTFNKMGETNIKEKMLDKEKEYMYNTELIKELKILLENKESNIIGDLAKETGVTEDKILNILSCLANAPVEISEKRENVMRESLQIGDKVEINYSGDGLTNNYEGLLSGHGTIRELRSKISDLQKLLNEKDELIKSLKETIELLKKRE